MARVRAGLRDPSQPARRIERPDELASLTPRALQRRSRAGRDIGIGIAIGFGLDFFALAGAVCATALRLHAWSSVARHNAVSAQGSRRCGVGTGMSPSGERGQTMAEYAVVLTVISAAIVATVAALSGAATTLIQRTVDVFSGIF